MNDCLATFLTGALSGPSLAGAGMTERGARATGRPLPA